MGPAEQVQLIQPHLYATTGFIQHNGLNFFIKLKLRQPLPSWKISGQIDSDFRWVVKEGEIGESLGEYYITLDFLNRGFCFGWRLLIFARSFILRNLFAIDPISKCLSGRVATLTLFCRMAAKTASRFFSA